MPEFRYAKGRIAESVRFIGDEMAEFDRDYTGILWQQYQEDRKLQKLMDRTVENILTALIEICGTFLADRGIAVENYADVLARCASILGFKVTDQEKLAALAVQRNRLAHRYLDFRWQAVRDFASKKSLVVRLLKLILDAEEKGSPVS